MQLNTLRQGFSHWMVKQLPPVFWRRRRWLNKTQWFYCQQLKEIQLRLLKNLVRHSYETVPYYRSLMDARGIRPGDIDSLEDIKQFPILSKETVVEQGLRLVSTKYPKLLVRQAQTGGTTGKPVTLYRDVFSIANEHAFVRRQHDWAGIKMGQRCAHLMARPIADPKKADGHLWDYDPIMKELVFSTYHLSFENAKRYLAVMKSYGVRAIYAFPSAMNMLCHAYGEMAEVPRIESIMTTAETLPETLKHRIEQTFRCPVFDSYGSSERVCYVFTCEFGTYHLQPEYGLTEFLPVGNRSTNEYRIISTGFWNRAMPLIRYDTGDVARLCDKQCPCGRQFRTVESIMGREGDVLVTKSGRRYGPAILTYLVRGTRNILESQIIQDKIDHVTIEFVPTENFSSKDLEDFHKSISKYLPDELGYGLKQVCKVKRTSGGKVRPVVSLLG